MIQAQEPIVDALISQLWAEVPDSYPRQRLVVLQAPELNHKRVRAKVAAFQEETCHDNSMSGGFAKPPWPPLAGCQGRSVEDERFALFVICGSGLQASEVGPMAKLGLGIGADDLEAPARRQPAFSLLCCTHRLQGRDPHAYVQLQAAGHLQEAAQH
eukprot:CAMPEP_0117674684 /NCGR_PEP_ID=MMETSP0804-20121206/15175_1 /TAXON_ID=1074897 /ORGANISM="Tetraselmis astigmatica, Strain CCMP880" /LENGTH=156 /DNA_ID=CAMNT_0005483581 /DNA_START=1615 /DNA_END=2085 /DNA_ORIENTATION=-